MSLTNSTTLHTYDNSVDKYIETSPQTVDGEVKNWIDKSLDGLDKKAKILEIGSGSGKDADYIESKGYNMLLTDGSKGFVEYLNRKGKSAKLLNAIKDDFDDNLDMIFADAVFLDFTPDELKSILKKSFKSLKKDGRLAFTLKTGDGEEITTRKLDSERYFCFWTESDINKLLNECGFVISKIIKAGDYRGKDRPDWLLIIANK